MSDTYQAVYDAIRSRFSGCDVGSAIESALRNENISYHVSMAAASIQQAAACYEEPSAIYRPKISIDGNQWCALYGDDLQRGVAGFGDSVQLAMADFNKNWYAKLPQSAPDLFKAMGLPSVNLPSSPA